VQHPDLGALLDAVAAAELRRKTAIDDTDASEKQKESEDSHLLGQEAAEEAAGDRGA